MPALRRALIGTLVAASSLIAAPAAPAAAKPVWLCKPGIKQNPCEPKLRTTVLAPSGETIGVTKAKRDKRRRIDCFYVYPTVSNQTTPQANLDIDPELRSIALYQASRFSRHCRVFAPVYRQVTLAGLGGEATQEMFETAYSDVLGAWRTYLRRHNRGRGVVLIGHSQGTVMLRRLAAERVDPRRKARRKLVSALLLGWPVTVAEGSDRGGDFERIGACRSKRQIGCVVAFSAFNAPVPGDASFGRTSEPGREVLCTNPGSLGGGGAALKTIYPTQPFAPGAIAAAIELVSSRPLPQVATPWVELRGAYGGRCSSADGANVLQISTALGAPRLRAVPAPEWGLHLADVNLPLGNLTDLVRAQGKRFVRQRR